ncbi:MAG: hypothetical protein LBK08_09310 [Treponema sp.]|jgi:hypothetical protein|nr:hypothetical protein [Treponema sp.]
MAGKKQPPELKKDKKEGAATWIVAVSGLIAALAALISAIATLIMAMK